MPLAPFQAFGIQHLATLAGIFVFSLLLPLGINRFASPRAATTTRWTLGTVLFTVKIGELIWYRTENIPWPWLLPLHLCDLAAFVTVAALFTLNTRLYEPAYYWAMAGTIQALLTPDLGAGFPGMGFWLFFVPHGLVITCIFFATGTLGLRPRPGSIGRVTVLTLASCVPAGVANWLWGTNYMYLREKPGAASLMDFMGPWPWYILTLVPVGLAFMALWYLPFWMSDRRRASSVSGPGKSSAPMD
jgi:hypothetical integral membrane protein (TIGR02206 family)